MALDGMAAPLGMKPRASGKGSPLPWRRVAVALFCAGIAFMLTVAALRRNGTGGEPMAMAVIERLPPAPDAPKANIRLTDPIPAAKAPATNAARTGAQEMEEQSGVRVIRQHGGTAPGATVIRVPDSMDSTHQETGRLLPAPDPRISDRAQYGILPRIGDGNMMARKLYARPFTASNKPMISVVLTGVGISAKGTADAISKLSGDITLAFAPYGRDLEAQVLRARRDGHEVMLQIPMEPFDYPDNDPGPHTLRAGGTPQENIERMHWLMSRFSGYVGVMNFMGGKVMSSNTAYQPVLEELNRRGLLILDDGNSKRSQTVELSRKIGLPHVKADKIAESTGSSTSLRSVLGDIEAIAVKTGRAIVSVPALPANIEILAAWESELAARGLVLAPLSAMAGTTTR